MNHLRRSLIVMVLTAGMGLGLAWAVRAQDAEPTRTAKSGDSVQVLLNDGRIVEGKLVSQSSDNVIVEIAGIEANYRRSEVAAVRPTPTAEERYQQRRDKLEDSDVEGRVRLARDMLRSGAPAIAERELEALVSEGREHPEIDRLLAAAQAQAQLREGEPAGSREPVEQPTRPAGPEEGENPEDPRDAERLPRLSKDQIRLMKVYELTFGEDGPRVQVPTATIEKFFTQYNDIPGVPRTRQEQIAFKRLSGEQQLRIMFNAEARDLYGEVLVYGDPLPIRDIRGGLHRTYVLNYCATSQCHGGPDSPGGQAFHLLRGPTSAESTLYTNFYWLQGYENAQGYMIDRDQEGRSLLLNYGLPSNLASNLAHPAVDGMQPVFNSVDDPRYTRYLASLQALYGDRPQDYGIEFAGQQGAAATESSDMPDPSEQTDSTTPDVESPGAPAPEDPAEGEGEGDGTPSAESER